MEIKCKNCGSENLMDLGVPSTVLSKEGYGVTFKTRNGGFLTQEYECDDCKTIQTMSAEFVFTDIDIF